MFRLFIVMGIAATVAMSYPLYANPLNQELRSILQTHPLIKAGKNQVLAREKEINEMRAGYYPTVRLSGDVGPETTETPASRLAAANSNRDSKIDLTRSRYGALIRQNVFRGFATHSRVKSAHLGKKANEEHLSFTTQEALFEGVVNYVDVLRQRRLISLAKTNEDTIRRQLNLENERVIRGSGITVDVLQAKSRLQVARERRVNFEGNFADAISRYSQVFGHAPNLSAMEDPSPPSASIPAELQDAVNIALAENPSLKVASTRSDIAEERRREVQSGFYPVVDLVGAYNNEDDYNGIRGEVKEYYGVVEANWEIFSGFATMSGSERAAFDYAASKDEVDDNVRHVAEQTKLAWQALLTNRERTDLLANAVNIASEVFDSRMKLRASGKETAINVLDAERELNIARIRHVEASYDELLAVYQLLRAMGRLTPQYLQM